MNFLDNRVFIIGAFLTGIIAGFYLHYIDKETQEPASSRYCINYCIKDHLSLSGGHVDYIEIKNHCRDFFQSISCCKHGKVYGECNIETIRLLQKK